MSVCRFSKEKPLRTLFDTYEERHAFVIGFGEVLPPWPSRLDKSSQVKVSLIKEYHYYAAGRTLGFLVLLGVIILAEKLLWR